MNSQNIDIEQAKLSLNQRKILRRAKSLIGKNKGRWNQQEKQKYFHFVKINHSFFKNNNQRRQDKVFMLMSNEIKTRTADQCRTHHQKLLSKFKQFSKILQFFCAQSETTQKQNLEKRLKIAKTVSQNFTTPQQLFKQQSFCTIEPQIVFLEIIQQQNLHFDIQIKQIDQFYPTTWLQQECNFF